MNEVKNDVALIAACGLYCGSCRAYIKGRCPGCPDNTKAGWCQIKKCCREMKIANCSACTVVSDVRDCKKYNNVIAKMFGFVFRSDRAACVRMIREKGAAEFARYMTENKWQSIKRR